MRDGGLIISKKILEFFDNFHDLKAILSILSRKLVFSLLNTFRPLLFLPFSILPVLYVASLLMSL